MLKYPLKYTFIHQDSIRASQNGILIASVNRESRKEIIH